ncbi:hypothetical protein OAL25_00055 [bacterium]|nr:hypothetical protein [bacterium]
MGQTKLLLMKMVVGVARKLKLELVLRVDKAVVDLRVDKVLMEPKVLKALRVHKDLRVLLARRVDRVQTQLALQV